MAPRANWKGFLRLSLVTCPVALYPATSDTEKVSFNQINRKTGHRIKYAKVDADTGEEVASEDIMKGYKVDTDTYIEVSKDELDDIALESTRTIEIDEFVPKTDIDNRYLIRPYYLVPDGKVGHDAFAVIRETIRSMNKVAIGRLVLTNREHIIALEPLDKGLMGTLLRYPYEVRSEKEYFDDIQDVKITKDMLDLAKHIVEQKSGSFEPDQFEDRYESALIELINQKRNGVQNAPKSAPATGGNVINLMDALKRSLANEKQSAPAAAKTTEKAKGKKPRKAAAGQREMLLPISGSGKRAAKQEPKQDEAGSEESREAGACAGPVEKGGLDAQALTAAHDRSGSGRDGDIAAAARLRCRGRRRSMNRYRLRGGARLTTLQHAADHVMRLPKDVQQQERGQIAVENLINAAEIGGGWLMFARIGMLRALNGDGEGR